MAGTTEESLTNDILQILEKEPGLEFGDIFKYLDAGNGILSERGVRNLVNKLERSGVIVKRKKWGKKQGAPPFGYYHPNSLPKQLNFLEEMPGVIETKITSKSEIERKSIDPSELKRLQESSSVLERIATRHLEADKYAKAIIDIAPQLANENPVDLLIQMLNWEIDNLNSLGEQVVSLMQRGRIEAADSVAAILNPRLKMAQRYFQRYWRLDSIIGNDESTGILDIPSFARDYRAGKKAKLLDENKARKRLQERIIGEKVLEYRSVTPNLHRSAAGTDASVADITLEHSQGSFVPPDPVIVMTAAATLKVRADKNDAGSFDYQDFDIFPEELQGYADYKAAIEGLVISPTLKPMLGEEDAKHARSAAMDLRQYIEDLRIVNKDAQWRPFGKSPELGLTHRTKLIIRDGRIFPTVHRLSDYEDVNLYGQIVRSEIGRFKLVFHNTVMDATSGFVYASAVKDPELSWLSPLIFWYIHKNGIKAENGALVVEEDDVYTYPFADTVVSHLLFLGLAMTLNADDLNSQKHFTTFHSIRRFSDIALEDKNVIEDYTSSLGPTYRRVVDSNPEDWSEVIRQSITHKRRTGSNNLDFDDYGEFIYLCYNAGVSSCYAAPTFSYKALVSDKGEGAHFLIPRLEIAVNVNDPNHEQEKRAFEGLLSWLAEDGGWDLDRYHTQSRFENDQQSNRSLPILVPDVIITAHETVTFARSEIGIEVQDALRELIENLRRRSNGRGRS